MFKKLNLIKKKRNLLPKHLRGNTYLTRKGSSEEEAYVRDPREGGTREWVNML